MSSDKFVSYWNINGSAASHIEIQYRTNSVLERYNHTLNNKFSSPHLPLLQFVTTLQEEVWCQVKRLKDIRKGKVIASKLKGSSIFEPPLCYKTFLP